MPRKIWLVMTPELPRAPMSAPKLMAAAIALGRLAGDRLRLVQGGLDRGQHVRAGVAVGDRVDVELVDLVDVGLEVGDGRPERLEQAVAVAGPSGHLGDVRAAVGEVARADPHRQRGRGRGQRPARRDVQAVDVDDEPGDLAAQRPADRVADRAVDLAGDLGDRHAERDRQVELDLEAVVVADLEPGLARARGGRAGGRSGHRRTR